MDHLNEIVSILLDLPTVHQWPILKELIIKIPNRSHFDWELPWYSAKAFGSENKAVTNGAAALACLQMSIILVDDILDEDPKGIHNEVGKGQAANLAQALQAAAFLLLAEIDFSPQKRIAATSLFARMSLQTAFGQQMDVSFDQLTEEQYWSIVQAKSVPFYQTALELGGIFSNIDRQNQEVLGELGGCLGEIIQIHDDMGDALDKPAGPDWLQNRLNLLILYATIVDHPQKEHFARLREKINEPEALGEAQRILIQCGAVSFAVYHLIKRNEFAHERIRSLLKSTDVPRKFDPQPLKYIFSLHFKPVITLLKSHHIPIPNELLLET